MSQTMAGGPRVQAGETTGDDGSPSDEGDAGDKPRTRRRLRGLRALTHRVVRVDRGPAPPAPRPAGRSSAVRLGIEEPLASHQPVLALTLLREVDGRDEVLVGVRTRHNGTHQNVMSVPTIRVLPEVAAGWARPLSDGVLPARTLDAHPTVERAVRRTVRDLLALKLGQADALERGEVEFSVEAMMAIQGTSLIGSRHGRDLTEDLTMFNAQVRWTAGHHLAPRRTAAYEPLLWISEDDFGRMVRTRDVGVLDAGLDEIEVCVRGLCVESAVRSLATHRS